MEGVGCDFSTDKTIIYSAAAGRLHLPCGIAHH